MAQRCLIVGIIGGDHNLECGEELGREIARRGWILLTGGSLLDRSLVICEGQVKEAAMLGAASVENEGIVRLIGILPERQAQGQEPKEPTWDRPSPHRLFLHTGLVHNIRNVINGRTPDVLVAFGGSRGTLAEIAFGLVAGRNVFVHRGFDRLRRNFEKYFSPDVNPDDRDLYLQVPLRSYPRAAGGVDELLEYLRRMFGAGNPQETSAAELADRIAATTIVRGCTGFPGLPHEDGANARFEGIVEEMSK